MDSTNEDPAPRDTHDLIVEELKIAGVYMKHDTANRSDSKIVFNEGERVWLSTEHLRLHNQPSKKFQQRYVGPYLITSKISDAAYELELPSTMQCHNVFHISKLRPCNAENTQPDYIPVSVEKERQEYIVDKIIEHDVATARDGFYERGPCLVFKVRWAGYDSSEDTWQTYQSIRRVQALDNFARDNIPFRRFLMTSRYADLHKRYPQRFPSFDT